MEGLDRMRARAQGLALGGLAPVLPDTVYAQCSAALLS